MVDWLSMNRVVGKESGGPGHSSKSRRRSQMASFTACMLAMYLALVLDSATDGCFLELQLMVALASIKAYLEVDLQSLTSPAQSASMNPHNSSPAGVPHWKTSLWSAVALR
jgi:hypothetical protein